MFDFNLHIHMVGVVLVTMYLEEGLRLRSLYPKLRKTVLCSVTLLPDIEESSLYIVALIHHCYTYVELFPILYDVIRHL